ncbi:hypothetical protein IJT17_09080, partial [bacterium]|nr:hypothetical protein [bacterium]
MNDKYSRARELLAAALLDEFKAKITGASDEPVVGNSPENRFFVGKLLSKGSGGSSGYGSELVIESVGADFYIDKSEIQSAEVMVFPRGEFYYRCYPTLEQQRAALLEEASQLFEKRFATFDDLMREILPPSDDADQSTPEKEIQASLNKYKDLKIKLIPVYKKLSLASPNFYFYFRPAALLDERGMFGRLDEHSRENALLLDQLHDIIEAINEDEYRYTIEINEQTTVYDLQSEEAYRSFLKSKGKSDVVIRLRWSIYLDVNIKRIKDRFLISVALVNNSLPGSRSRSVPASKHSNDMLTVETLFNSGIDISLRGANYAPIELDYFVDDYKYDKEQHAIGLNCSVSFNRENNTVSTEHLPTYVQKRLVTNDSLAVRFQDLIDDPLTTLKNIRVKMDAELVVWKEYYAEEEAGLTRTGQERMSAEIAEFQREIERFQRGIDTIYRFPQVLKSFILMNRTFLATSKKFNTWRLFQIVFIVSLIPDIVACDANMMLPEEKL